jgi:TusA-related sulfurtransferase
MSSEKKGIILSNIKSDKVMDTRGLTSPMPFLKTRNALSCLEANKILEVWCTDPESGADIQEIDTKEGTYLGRIHDPDGYIRLFIQRGMRQAL